MKKPTMKNALLDIAEGINGLIDNWDYWNDEQKKECAWSLQGLACRALPEKLTVKEQVEKYVRTTAKTLIVVVGLVVGLQAMSHAYDTSRNPDKVPSFGLDIWKGQVAGLDRQTVETTGGTVGGHFDFRQPVTNALTVHAFAESEGIDNNLRYSSGYKVGMGLRVFLQD